MNITPIGPSIEYDSTRPAQTTAVPQSTPPQALQDMPLELPTQESIETETASFADSVGRMFRDAGISIPPEPILGSDAAGAVRVSNEHPDKEKIERLFADNPNLQQSFARISSWSSLQRAAEHFQVFASEYKRLQDRPDVLRALVETEIARNNAPFYMAITADGTESFFGNSVDIKV
ncbi:MAG TPA: hypothetical protein VL381_07040 [Rhodocyclaceae bacterium]|jgi:hypothetical protein|nr:hypothetical protein [Rhodocyclaceae bacterium]